MADNFNTRLYARGYSSSVSMRAPTSKKHETPCCIPDCADCGLLECLCRPRFFAGQLLTEQDLNRLDSYIRAKNRMHNLHLHGWGVVNGLQVRCDSCGSGVTVGAGYAIDPCGEDIVVCNDTPVDICALIKRCQQVDITCVPSSRTGGTSTCDDVEEDWVLAIRYLETQSRGVTALRSTPSCACKPSSSGCSCGGGCGCGCSGGKKSSSASPTNAMSAHTARKPRSTPTECEATAICEGYAFDVFRAPNDDKRDPKLSGPLIDTFRCCIEPLTKSLPTPPGAYGNYSQNRDAWILWCCRMKDALIGFFSNGPQANCTLTETIQSYVCPGKNDPNFDAEMQQLVDIYNVLLIEAMFACLCNALLPPAPCGTSDDRVPLAIVTVRKKDCKVLRVCNWTHLRKIAITMPALEYWFGWIPWFKSIQDAIAGFCCADIRMPEPPRDNGPVILRTAEVPPPEAASMKVNTMLDPDLVRDNQTMSTLFMNMFARAGAPMDPAAVASGIYGHASPSKQPLTEAERANVGPFLLLNQILRPVLGSMVPANLAARKPLEVTEAIANGGETTESLHARVAKLEKAIKEMGGNIP
jgi:hypothetical protein